MKTHCQTDTRQTPVNVFNVLLDVREYVRGNRRTQNFYRNKNYRKASFKSLLAWITCGSHYTKLYDVNTLKFLISPCAGPPDN